MLEVKIVGCGVDTLVLMSATLTSSFRLLFKVCRVSWMIYSRSSGLSFGEVVAATVSLLKLACFFKSLFSILIALEVSEGNALILVVVGIVGIKTDGLFVGGESFLVALEVSESDAFAVVGWT